MVVFVQWFILCEANLKECFIALFIFSKEASLTSFLMLGACMPWSEISKPSRNWGLSSGLLLKTQYPWAVSGRDAIWKPRWASFPEAFSVLKSPTVISSFMQTNKASLRLECVGFSSPFWVLLKGQRSKQSRYSWRVSLLCWDTVAVRHLALFPKMRMLPPICKWMSSLFKKQSARARWSPELGWQRSISDIIALSPS